MILLPECVDGRGMGPLTEGPRSGRARWLGWAGWARTGPLAWVAVLACFAVGVGACDDGRKPDANPPQEGCAGVGGAVPIQRPLPPLPLTGAVHAQEVWITYDSPAHAHMGRRFTRPRETALALAHELCRRAIKGESLGSLARAYSGAPGAVAQGFAGVLPRNPAAPDERDLAVVQTPLGQLTPILDWNGGFWFAAPVGEAKGKLLREEFERYRRLRARVRVIAIHYAGAFPSRMEFDQFPRESAVARAKELIAEIQAGADFAELAGRTSNDGPSRKVGGLLTAVDPETGERTEWLHWGDMDYPQALLEVALETGAVGRVLPTPLDTERGVFVVWVEERKP